MSICPDKNLRSAYLDGEVSSPWCEEMTAHIESCPECKKALEQMKQLHSVFAEDSASLDFDNTKLDESFERLQSRLRYTKVAAKSNVVYADFARKIVPYAAAAVFLAAIIFPSANIRSQMQQRFTDVALVSQQQSVELINKKGIVAEQTINASAVKVANTAQNAAVTNAPVALHVSNLTKIDYFKPESTAEAAQMSVKLPDVADLPLILSDSESSSIVEPEFYR